MARRGLDAIGVADPPPIPVIGREPVRKTDEVVSELDELMEKLGEFKSEWESLGGTELSTFDAESEPEPDVGESLSDAPTLIDA